jgi:RecA-family ATPase
MPLSVLRAFDADNDPTCLVGNRWLCKGGSLLLVSQSGVGKSSFTLQMLICLAIGRPFFGIQAKRPLRIVMGQAENDSGDVAQAFQSICQGLMLYPDEERLLDENLHIYRDTHSVGPAFIERMRELIIRHNADWYTCDPLMSFCGIEVSDQKQMTEFLRHGINPVLEETGAVFMAVHHTTKPRSAKDKEGQTVADLAYAGSGSSELTNWAREVACLQRCQGDEPVFKFALTKRRGRAGLKDHADQFANEITIRHARQKGVVRWEYATPEEATPAQTATRPVRKDGDSSPAKGSPRRFNAD